MAMTSKRDVKDNDCRKKQPGDHGFHPSKKSVVTNFSEKNATIETVSRDPSSLFARIKLPIPNATEK